MSTLNVSNITDGTEVYTPINGFYGFVSNRGNVKDRNGNVRKMHTSNSGYYRIALSMNGKRVNQSVHRLVAEYFCCGKQDGYQVNHIDGNKENNCEYGIVINNGEKIFKLSDTIFQIPAIYIV